MKNKWILIPLVCVIAGIGLGSAGYFAIDGYLQNRFGPNTWVGDIYCTGKTVEEVNRELLAQMEAPVVTVRDLKGDLYTLNLGETDYQYFFTEVLGPFQKNQTSSSWIENLKSRHEIELGTPAFSYDRKKLIEWWEELPIVQAERTDPVLSLALDENGYKLFSTLENHLDVEKSLARLIDAVESGETNVSLGEDCYFDYQMNSQHKNVYHTWEDLTAMEQCGLTYDMGAEKIVFDTGLMSRFIAKDALDQPLYDEDGKLYFDRNAVDAYIEELCGQYNTYGVEHDFISSRGEVVRVPGGNYGTELNMEREKEFLWEYLNDEESRLSETVHVPSYIHVTPFRGLNDLGNTYIEVDMGEQKLYFYKEDELLVETDIVSGDLALNRDTPPGVFTIYYKTRNTVLRGPGYAQRVRRWMAVNGGIGLHDASWRDEFGGEIYKTDGSHGCINLPDDAADIIYDNAKIGTPVVMFY